MSGLSRSPYAFQSRKSRRERKARAGELNDVLAAFIPGVAAVSGDVVAKLIPSSDQG
jgi:hypothetical protein